MGFLPRAMGTRPRLACEIRSEGVVAARAGNSTATLDAVAQAALQEGIVSPRVPAGEPGVTVASAAANSAANGVLATIGGGPAGRTALVEAIRTTLESVAGKARDVTLVVPDAAVRVLLLDFDELPAKESEALSVVRFRLKKLLPFDADDAAVSYQIMSNTRGGLQVLAVAMPKQALSDYESVVRDAGFEPGAVLPSTLAALAGLGADEIPVLVVNAGREGVTTAIVKGGALLLHRTVDLGGQISLVHDNGHASVIADAEEPSAAAPVETSIAAIAARMAAAPPTVVPAPTDASSEVNSAAQSEVAQAVSVATAYFEDTLQSPPSVVLSAGTLGAPALLAALDRISIGAGTGSMAVQEMVDRQMLGVEAASAAIPLGWLAGVRGVLANG